MLVVTNSSDQTYYEDNVYPLSVGDVINMTHPMQFETLHNRVQTWLPATLSKFEVEPIPSGTRLYSIYGANCAVVSEKVVA